MAATTLLQFATEQDQQRKQALAAALAASAAALTADRAAETARLAAVAAAATARTAVDAVRRALAAAQTPAEVTALSTQLKNATVAQRSATDAAASAELRRAQAGAALESARQLAELAKGAGDGSAAALAQATAEDARRQDIIGRALVASPLQDVVAEATAALGSPAFAAAKARIENALPQALRDRVRERARQAALADAGWVGRVQAAEAAFDTEVEASGLDADTVARLQRALARADAALSTYAGQAVSRLRSAQASLERLAALAEPPLTVEQKASLDDLQGTARPDAAAAEDARDTAALALVDAATAYAGQRLKALARDPDGDLAVMEADAVQFPDLAQARTNFDAAVADHSAKAAAFTAAAAKLLAEWQAEVPEALWAEAASFYAMEDGFTAMQGAPAGLVTAVQTAETALTTALEGAAERQRRLEFVATRLDSEQVLARAVAKRAAERSTNALRGGLAIDPLLQP